MIVTSTMRRLLISVVVVVMMAVPVFAEDTTEQAERKIPAFPGAEGFGIYTLGGRGGKVYPVTTLEDYGENEEPIPGSLRQAVEAEGPRTVIFRVSGIITLKKRLSIKNPFITIAGQTAPGDGICIRNQTLAIDTHDVILRYLRCRRGNFKDRNDCIGGTPIRNIIVDHCSTSWGLDENISMYKQSKRSEQGPYLPSENITIQWCISSEALDINNHAFGGTWGGKNCSFHHNLFACNTGRNPSIAYPLTLDIRNNVLFNWRHRTMDGADGSAMINIVANYYKPGPATNPGEIQYRVCKPEIRPDGYRYPGTGKWYVADNYVHGYPDVTANNWDGGVQFEVSGVKIEDVRAKVPIPVVSITQQTAEEAYELVLAHAGATLPRRDPVDVRIMESVRTGKPTFGNGIIDFPADVGGWPEYKSLPAPADSDNDGMPDEWEIKYHLIPDDATDGNMDKDGDGYTNVEEYLNDTDPTEYIDYTKPENNKHSLFFHR